MNESQSTFKNKNEVIPSAYVRWLTNSPDKPGPCDEYLQWSYNAIPGSQTTINLKGMVIT